MDQNPWTYLAMAKEMLREGRIESPSDPATPGVGDQRSYLYIEIDKDTTPPNPPAGSWIGVAVGVRVAGDPAIYRSDHLVSDWSTVSVTDVNRAFFLDDAYRPQSSFPDWSGAVTLTPAVPEATIWNTAS